MSNILFITGCNGQLGRAISKKYKENGWLVAGMDVTQHDDIEHLSIAVKGSVLSRSNWERLFDYGYKQIRNDSRICLINNAGIAKFNPPEARSIEEFDEVMRINLFGPIAGMTEFKKFIDHAIKFQPGIKSSIINIASIYGHQSPNESIYTDTSRNSSEIYGASKAGLVHLTKYFAVRYASIPIQVNAISPGGVLNSQLQGDDFIRRYSNLVPQKRMCYEKEVADLSYAMIDFPSYLTGQCILLDGGMSSW